LVVVHHMAKNEIPLAIETYNGVINLMCKIERIGLALEAIERFQEHGIKPNAGTFLPIYNALRMQSSEEFLRLHRLMRTNNVYI
ncbi:5322_t:CDS:1, partial [Acaulospora morrowiae]